MIGKVLVLIVVITVVYFIFFKKKKIKDSKEVEQMIECEKCGTYISFKESIMKSGKQYCSKECAGLK